MKELINDLKIVKLRYWVALLAIVAIGLTGCLTVQTPVVSQTGTGTNGAPIYATNIVVSVNTNTLIMDQTIITGAVSAAVTIAVSKDTNCIPALKTAQTILNGVLNGSNPTTTGQLLAMLGSNNNSALAGEITPVIGTISSLEQQLLAQFGGSVAGQITIAFNKAILAGINIGLTGH